MRAEAATRSASFAPRRTAGDAGAVLHLLTVALAGAACTFSLFAWSVLPERFLMDNDHIAWVMNGPVEFPEDSGSFQNVGMLYTALGLNDKPALTGLLTLMLFTVTVFSAAHWSDIARFGWIGAGVLLISFACASVYLAQYSKECMPLMLVLLLMVMPRHLVSELVFIVLAILYAIWFRPYWAIIAALYVGWRYWLRKERRVTTSVLVVILVYAVLQLIFAIFVGTSLTATRTAVNDSRMNEDVGSLISDPLPSTPLLMVPNALLLLLSLIVPVPLLLKQSVFHLISGLMIAFIWIASLTQIFGTRQKAVRGLGSSPLTSVAAGRCLRAARASALLISVVCVQAIFEPDFGSYLKHLTPLMPLFIALVPFRKGSDAREDDIVTAARYEVPS